MHTKVPATEEPVGQDWDTTKISDGEVQLDAQLKDAQGILLASANSYVVVENMPAQQPSPTLRITSPAHDGEKVRGVGHFTVQAQGAIPPGSHISLNIRTNQNISARVPATENPVGQDWDTTKVSNGEVQLDAQLKDAQGILLASANSYVVVDNATINAQLADTIRVVAAQRARQQGPTISITSPARENQKVSGIVHIVAQTQGAIPPDYFISLRAVESQQHGQQFRPDQTFELDWDTTRDENGPMMIRAEFTDRSGEFRNDQAFAQRRVIIENEIEDDNENSKSSPQKIDPKILKALSKFSKSKKGASK